MCKISIKYFTHHGLIKEKIMIENRHPLLLISGLAADDSIFVKQTAAFREVIHVTWVEPSAGDTLEDYADKLAVSVAERVGGRECYVAGLSLGGMLAPMVAERFRTKACILIASIRGPAEFPRRYRPFSFVCRRTPWLVGTAHFIAKTLGRCLMPLLRRGRSPERLILLQQLLGGRSRLFAQHLRMLFTWANNSKSQRSVPSFPIYHIHGRGDRVLPCGLTTPDKIIDGRHVLPLYQAQEVNRFIESVMEETE